ncbi:hypothetical protein CYMTET_13856 [Cymbomonas tetramitiformis]|uniref:G-patch domain-containing protein n=1 Tax=Cymbomonas tetramitiformis TaxID=36881 RepID=A0AAE0LAG8_9CHLO|nr:hypothetical protein CYMTET_13856 [Cymbomonas tetramitiformis]|eukprot:gene23883-28978_t
MTDSKLAFGFSKTQPKPKALGSAVTGTSKEERDYVTNVSADGVNSIKPVSQANKPVIAAQQNTFQVGQKRKVELFLPESEENKTNDERFESDATTLVSDKSVTYGLTKVEKPEGTEGDIQRAKQESVIARANDKIKDRSKEDRQFKAEVNSLPEQATADEYETMPIELFGEALLRGMGWEEGKAVGKNQTGPAVAMEYVPRPKGLGLGATPAAPAEDARKYIKSGETRGPKPDMVVYDENGKVKNLRTLDEKLVERVAPGPAPGKTMVVIAGTHKGLTVEVTSIEKREGRSDRAKVVLKPSQSQDVVSCRDLADLDSPEAEKAVKHLQGVSERPQQKSTLGNKHEHKLKSREKESISLKDSWLIPDIMVKITSKRIEEGRFYLKKARVVDVTAPGRCTVEIQASGQVVHDVSQRSLETTFPAKGGRVIMVKGQCNGQRGKLLDRNSKAERAAIAFNSDGSIHKVHLDDVCEFIGPEDDDD